MTKQSEEKQFYTTYYKAVAASQANERFCTQLFGKNMAQHGFAEVAHVDHLVDVCRIQQGMSVLDLGCGSGLISEYISDQTGALVTGIDYIASAINEARQRTREKKHRLVFKSMDMKKIAFPPASFDVILSIDTFYFVNLTHFLPKLVTLLAPGGRIGAFFSQTWEPWTPFESFDLSTIHPDRTGLAAACHTLGLTYTTWEYTLQDVDHARRKLSICESLKAEFEAEGNHFLYENHVAEAKGIQQAYAAGAHGRWLYYIEPPPKVSDGTLD